MNMMVPTIQKERPPFVRFEVREMGLDQVATEREKRPIPREVVMAIITPWGSKDEIEKIAEEWIADIKRKAMLGSYPLEWSTHFELQFTEWQKGNELPREGTPIRTWAMIAKQEPRRRLQALGIHTVEDLAAVPDSGLGQIGLDGRYLRDLARGWLAEAKEKGASAKDLADANARIEQLEGVIERSNARIARLEAQLDVAPPEEGRRGRRRQAETEA